MMNAKQLRDRVFIAHQCLGLAIGLLAVPIGLTGSLLILPAFWNDLTATKVTPIGTKWPIATIVAKVRSLYPNLTLNSIDLPTKSTEPIVAYLGKHYIQIDPYTGNPIGQLVTDNNDITGWLYQVHIQLLGGDWGGYLAGIVGLLMTVLAITGIILWPGWRKLSTGFKIKWNAKTKRLKRSADDRR